MQAQVGDRIVIHAHHYGDVTRDCQVLEIVGPDGGPPYRVRWSDRDHDSLFTPGSDAVVEHLAHKSR